MGLTESNHSKAATGCTGPSKSRSTPHFPDSRGYQNRPRQAATLPARPTPENSQTPPYHHPRTPVHDPQPLGHDPRPPETEPTYRDNFVQVGRSPNFRPIATRRSASADSRKRRSDPLLDAKTLKQYPEIVSFQQDPTSQVSRPPSKVSPPSSPKTNYQRPRPTAIYVANDQPAHMIRTREGRSRDRSGVKGKSRDSQRTSTRDRSRGSGERGQRAVHVSTFTMTPHCPENSPMHSSSNQIQPPTYQKQKKTRHRSGQRVEYTASSSPQGDPYVCLHYGGTMKNGERKPVQQVTAWRTDHVEEPPSPNRQMSQVVIHMNQVTATTLDNYDALNANIESIQVRRNVWFQASRALGSPSEAPIRRKISSKAMRTPSICETTSGYDNNEIIPWPDVTNKVSSIYMRPEMRIGNKSHSRREQFTYDREFSSHYSHDLDSSSISDHQCIVNKQLKEIPVPPIYQVSYGLQSEAERPYMIDQATQQNNDIFDYPTNSVAAFPETKEMKDSVRIPSHIEIDPPFEFSEASYANGDLHSSLASKEREQECISGCESKENEENDMCSQVNNQELELHFGINNHIEDYTIIEDGSNEGQFYGCRDSEHENESSLFAACDSLLSGSTGHCALQAYDQDKAVECTDKGNMPLDDKTDKETTIDVVNDLVSHSSASGQTEQFTENCDVKIRKNKSSERYKISVSKTLNERDLGEFYKKQYELVSQYLSLKDPGIWKIGERESDVHEKFSYHPCVSRPSDTVPGSPSASSAFSQKCLIQSSSLPRHLQCVSRSATTDSGNVDDMRAFRNRFRSFDLGHFPVLRLPLGNQPRLVDVLRASASRFQEQEENNVSQEKNHEQGIPTSDSAIQHISSKDASPSSVSDPLVSYPDRLSSPQRDDEVIDSGATFPLPCDSGAPSKNSHRNEDDDDDRGRNEMPWLPNSQGISSSHDHDSCLSDEGCDTGTIIRGAISGVDCSILSYDAADAGASLDLTFHEGDEAVMQGAGTGVTAVNQKENKVIAGSRNGTVTWHQQQEQEQEQADSGCFHVVGSYRWSNDGMGDGDDDGAGGESHSPDDGTLRAPQKVINAFHVDKRRANSDCSLLQRRRTVPSETFDGDVPDIIPPFNRHIRRKAAAAASRRSIHSIDWDTPLPTIPFNASKADCNYTCHEQCQDLVTLDCKADLTPDSNASEDDLYIDTDPGTMVEHKTLSSQNLSITVTSQEEELEEEEEDYQEEQEEKHEEEQQEKELLEEPIRKNEEVSTLRKSVNRLQSHLVDNETLEAWVEKYNATTQGLQIAKESDGSYRGCIRVHLNLSRPINIVAGTRPPSIYDILQEDRTMEKTLTSFYMPRDAVKAIHITSKTTTREVIIALLRKFKVVDNPQKFALYERTYDTGQPGKAKLRRLGDSECPLVLAINWSAEGLTNKRLVLQENDTADIQWEAFSLPELSNFLRILDREEEEYRCQIKDKYTLLRRRIGNMLIQTSPAES